MRKPSQRGANRFILDRKKAIPKSFIAASRTPPWLLSDGDVGVGVFPEGEEILVGGERPDAGGIGIRTLCLRGSRLQGIGTSHAEMRQRSRPAVPYDAAVVEDLLKLGDLAQGRPTLKN